jgi:hypothetical protein
MIQAVPMWRKVPEDESRYPVALNSCGQGASETLALRSHFVEILSFSLSRIFCRL